jgi:hypothetical protein
MIIYIKNGIFKPNLMIYGSYSFGMTLIILVFFKYMKNLRGFAAGVMILIESLNFVITPGSFQNIMNMEMAEISLMFLYGLLLSNNWKMTSTIFGIL